MHDRVGVEPVFYPQRIDDPLAADAQSFFSAVVSGAAGAYIVTLHDDVEINTDMVIQPGQDVRISGDPDLVAQPCWGGGFTVQQDGSLSVAGVVLEGALIVLAGGSLTLQSTTVTVSGRLSVAGGTAYVSGCTLDAFVYGSAEALSTPVLHLMAITLSGGGSLSLTSMAIPVAVLGSAMQLSDAGSTLWLSAVAVPDWPELPAALTGTVTVGADGSQTKDPADLALPPMCCSTWAPANGCGSCCGDWGPPFHPDGLSLECGGGGGDCSYCDVCGTSDGGWWDTHCLRYC